jgi:hypothetical protein
VQVLTLVLQTFLLGRILNRFGLMAVMLVVPALMVVGFSWLALHPMLWVLIAAMMIRRVGGVCRHAPQPRDAVHDRAARIQVQGQELHRHGGLPRWRRVVRVGAFIAGRNRPDESGIAWAGTVIAALWGLSAFSVAKRHEERERENH